MAKRGPTLRVESAVDGDYWGVCRTCWKRRNMGLNWRPQGKTGIFYCGSKNPDGSTCHGRLLICMTEAAERRVKISRKQKKAEAYKK